MKNVIIVLMIDTNKYQAQLLAKKNQLTSELAEMGVQEENNEANWEVTTPVEEYDTSEEGELAGELDDEANKRVVLEGLEDELRLVDGALERIAENKYGLCKVCGTEIESERLDIVPEAETCKEHLEA